MTDTIKCLIHKTIGDLTYKAIVTYSENFGYWFDKDEHHHVICIPHDIFKDEYIETYDTELSVCEQLGLLHELSHAWLSDKVHRLFGTIDVKTNHINDRHLSKTAIKYAQDWFVEYRMFYIAGEARLSCWKVEATDALAEVESAFIIGPLDYRHILHAGFVNAVSQMFKYPLVDTIRNSTVDEIVAAFMSTPPILPSDSEIVTLICKLLRPFKPCTATFSSDCIEIDFIDSQLV